MKPSHATVPPYRTASVEIEKGLHLLQLAVFVGEDVRGQELIAIGRRGHRAHEVHRGHAVRHVGVAAIPVDDGVGEAQESSSAATS